MGGMAIPWREAQGQAPKEASCRLRWGVRGGSLRGSPRGSPRGLRGSPRGLRASFRGVSVGSPGVSGGLRVGNEFRRLASTLNCCVDEEIQNNCVFTIKMVTHDAKTRCDGPPLCACCAC